MSDGLSIDVSSIFPYLEEKIRSWLHQDAAHVEAREFLRSHLRTVANDAIAVQIIGMDKPVPILDIYQPTRLSQKRLQRTDIDVQELLSQNKSAIIFAGPGHGKTMFLRYTFNRLARSTEYFPVLFELRDRDAATAVQKLVKYLETGHLRPPRSSRIVLLLDGYDEISIADRGVISDSLRDFAGRKCGNFYVTCRSFYDTGGLTAEHFHIAEFDRLDAERFVASFANAYGTSINPAGLLDDLHQRGFGDFADHPLLLALICILRSGPLPEIPRTAIALVKRALDTLTIRWDSSRGVRRNSEIDLTGDERIRCMMQIAYTMDTLSAHEARVEAAVKQHLHLTHRTDVNTDKLLSEIAQWYGVLIPSSVSEWSFTHRTIHDYLAARFWVDSGFRPREVQAWNTRAAYGACLSTNATESMCVALRSDAEVHAFVECLMNKVPFEASDVASAVIDHFEIFPDVYTGRVTPDRRLTLSTEQDFFHHTSDDLLSSAVQLSRTGTGAAHDLVFWFGLSEYRRRGLQIAESIVTEARTRLGNLLRAEVERHDGVEYLSPDLLAS